MRLPKTGAPSGGSAGGRGCSVPTPYCADIHSNSDAGAFSPPPPPPHLTGNAAPLLASLSAPLARQVIYTSRSVSACRGTGLPDRLTRHGGAAPPTFPSRRLGRRCRAGRPVRRGGRAGGRGGVPVRRQTKRTAAAPSDVRDWGIRTVCIIGPRRDDSDRRALRLLDALPAVGVGVSE